LQYDFVICGKDASVLAAIELDDKPGNEKASTRCAGIKERASVAAGVRWVRWQATAMPNQTEILELFGELELPLAEEMEPNANQSWWLPVPNARPDAPASRPPTSYSRP
jgi:hypothetical protein